LKHVLVLALVLAVALLIAAPAAFADSNGARSDYTTVYGATFENCANCHDTGGIGPTVVPAWLTSAHSMLGDVNAFTANALPVSEGPACAGCHSGNYDPSKAQGALEPGPTATPTVYPTGTPAPDSTAAYSEPYVGCADCHYNGARMHDAGFKYGSLANPDICGQCHARYGKTVATYTYTPQPAASPTTIQPQYPVVYDPFPSPLASPSGAYQPAAPLSDVLNIPMPATPIGNLFWPDPITASGRAHGESAVQYEEMMQNRFTGTGFPAVTHMNALDTLKAIGNGTNTACLPCHSADYQIQVANGVPSPDPSSLLYGDACVTCHDPHAAGDQQSVFNSGRNPQLVSSQATLCTKCHNTEVPEDQNGQIVAGEEIHHPQQEMMAGTSLTDLGVPNTPSVHKGDCVQCHMVPTGIEFDGVPGTGANHLFKVITPEYAATHTMTVSGRTGPMPNSACGQCHATKTDDLALYLQPVLDARQSLFDQQVAALATKLDTAATGIGYADAESASADIGEPSDPTSTNPSVMAFLKAETIYEFVTQDSSRGIHNWAYTEKAIDAANAWVAQVAPIPFTVTLKASKTSVKTGTKITLSGTVSSSFQSAGKKVTIQKKSGSSWKTVTSVVVTAAVAPSTDGTYTYKWKVPKGATTLRAKFGPYTFSGVTRPVGYSKTVKVTGK
jgi:predicted CXXCH cytochrome family protein